MLGSSSLDVNFLSMNKTCQYSNRGGNQFGMLIASRLSKLPDFHFLAKFNLYLLVDKLSGRLGTQFVFRRKLDFKQCSIIQLPIN